MELAPELVSSSGPAGLEQPTDLPRAAACMVAAALLFAVMSLMVKLLSQTLPSPVVVFLRTSLGLLVLLPLVAARGFSKLRTTHLREHLVRGAVGMAAMYCFFFAIARLGLAEALLFNYSLPLFIPLVERVWLGEPAPVGLWKPLTVGMLGLTLILKPGLAMFQPAAVVALLGAVFAATAQVGVRGLTRTQTVTQIVFYFSAVSSAIALLPAALVWVTPATANVPLLVGLVSSGTLAQLLMTRAYHLAPAAQVGPFIYASVAFAAFFDWLAFDRRPDALSAFGTGLVVVAGVLALRRRRAVVGVLPAG